MTLENIPKFETSTEESETPDLHLLEEVEELLESNLLPRGPRFEYWENAINNENISNDELKAILVEIKNVITKRKTPEIRIKIYSKDLTDAERKELEDDINNNRENLYHSLKVVSNDPNSFLGNGSVAEVYIVSSWSKNLCIKTIANDEMYNELNLTGGRVQNKIEAEGEFLESLTNFEISGVRTPRPSFYIETIDFKGIAMEALPAVNFARVIEGHDELPKNFNLEDYFNRLEEYFIALHNKGVLHKDVALRNFMIDTETGNPWLIDFGRSKWKSDYYASEKDFEEECLDEMEALKIAKNDAIKKLKNN